MLNVNKVRIDTLARSGAYDDEKTWSFSDSYVQTDLTILDLTAYELILDMSYDYGITCTRNLLWDGGSSGSQVDQTNLSDTKTCGTLKYYIQRDGSTIYSGKHTDSDSLSGTSDKNVGDVYVSTGQSAPYDTLLIPNSGLSFAPTANPTLAYSVVSNKLKIDITGTLLTVSDWVGTPLTGSDMSWSFTGSPDPNGYYADITWGGGESGLKYYIKARLHKIS